MLRSSLYNGFVEGHFDNIGEAGDVENKNNYNKPIIIMLCYIISLSLYISESENKWTLNIKIPINNASPNSAV